LSAKTLFLLLAKSQTTLGNPWKSLDFQEFENNLKSFGILGFLRMSNGFLSFTKTNTRVCGLAKLQECGGAITRQRMIFDTLERLRAD